MNIEQLQKGTNLEKEIAHLKNQLSYWNDFVKLGPTKIGYDNSIRNPSNPGVFYIDVETRFINQDVLKTLTIQAIHSELEEKIKQFQEL